MRNKRDEKELNRKSVYSTEENQKWSKLHSRYVTTSEKRSKKPSGNKIETAQSWTIEKDFT